MAMGRPTDYKPEYCEMLIAHMAKGMPYETFAAVIDTHRDTLYEWEKKHKEFSDAKKIAREKQYKQLAEMGLSGITGNITYTSNEKTVKKVIKGKAGEPDKEVITTHKTKSNGFSTGGWAFFMKNMQGWKDQPDFNDNDLIEEVSFVGEGDEDDGS